MVHERYIKRGGKIHGPYYYESYREDGKVKKRYIGKSIENNYWKNNSVVLLILAGFVLLLLFSFLYFSSQITGRVLLDSSLRYREGDILTGNLKLVLKTGELIPKESKIVISNGGGSKEFILSDFVDVEMSAGNFFVEGIGELGNGEGYGVEGIRVIYPEVNFDFLVFNAREDEAGVERPVVNESVVSGLNESVSVTGNISESNATQGVQNVSDANFTIVEKIEMAKEAVDVKISEEQESFNEVVDEEEKIDVGADEEEKIEETIDANASMEGAKEKKKEAAKKGIKTKATKQMMQKKKEKKELKKDEEKKEATKASDKAKTNAKKEVNDKIKRAVNEAVKKAKEEAKAQGKILTKKQIDRIRKETRKKLAGEQAVGEEGSEAEEGGEAGEEQGGEITENASIINSTINPGITGGVIIENIESYGNEHIVSGKISYNSSLIFILEEGQSAHVVPGSVRADGNETDDSIVESEITDDFAVFSTEYVVFEEGFGKEFLSEEQLILRIDFSKFNIIARDENLEVSVIYQDKVLGDMKKNLSIIGKKAEQSEIQLKLLKEIEDIRIFPSGNYTINLSEHFSGAERYEIVMQNITSALDGESLTLKADEGFRGAREGKITAYSGNESLESNKFEILVSSGKLDVETIRKSERIVIGEPVKWVKNVSLESAENITIELPDEAENISVKKIEDGEERETEATVQRSVIIGSVINVEDKRQGFSLKEILKFAGFVVEDGGGNSGGAQEIIEVILEDNATEYTIEYETPAPEAFEEETDEGKKVIISGPDDLNYTNVLAYTNISEVLKVGQEEIIRIKWSESGTNVEFEAYDLDGNEYLDYVEWNVPHLSNQTFEIILITDAVELDSNREFVRNVYEEVRERDGNWTGEIGAGRYVRVTFERNLTSLKDITIYARSNYTNSSLGVYEKNGEEELANFGLISEDKKYQVFLDGSSGAGLSGEQDTFDLLVENSGIDFDFIIDPIPSVYTNVSSCGDLGAANTYYVLNVSLNTTGTCLTVRENNITIDLNGYNMTGDNSAHGEWIDEAGINITGYNQTTVKNGYIHGFIIGVYSDTANNGTFDNLTITANGVFSVAFLLPLHGVYILRGTGNSLINSNITNLTNTASTVSTRAVRVSRSTNSLLENNTIIKTSAGSANSGNAWGIYMDFSNGSILRNNNISFSIGLSSAGRALYMERAYYNLISGGEITNSSWTAIEINNGEYNNFTNVRIFGTADAFSSLEGYDIKFGGAIRLTDMPYIENYTFGAVRQNVTFVDSVNGEINFFGGINGSGINLTNDVRIRNNSVIVETDGNRGLIYPANITLYGIGERDISNIAVVTNNTKACTQSTKPACYNFTALNANTVIFNVSSWSNYSIGNALTTCGLSLQTPNTNYVLSENLVTTGTCFTIKADNVTINLNGYNLTGDVNSATDYGVYVNGANYTNVTNGYIRNFTIGVYIFEAFNNTVTNLTISSSGNPGANGNVTAIYSIGGNGNKIWYNNITSMNHTGGGRAIGIATEAGSRINYIENNSIFYLNSSGTSNSFAIYSTVNNNTYRGNKIYGRVDYGYYFTTALRNSVEFGSVNNTRAELVYISGSHNNTFKQVDLQTAGSGYRKVYVSDSMLLEFVNMSFPSITFDDSSLASTVYKSWILTVSNVTNSTNNVLSDVRIKVSDNESVMHRVEFTNGSGYLETFAPEAVNTSASYRNLTSVVQARKSGYLRNNTYLNMSRNINVSFILQRDNIAPSISLVSSVDTTTTGNKTFGFVVDDDSDLTSCTLYVDGTETQTKSSGLDPEGRTNIYQVIGSIGTYSWIIGCTDVNGNQRNSSSAGFTIASSSGGGSSGTGTVPKVVAKCVSSYSCQDWGVCANGEQQRECIDTACFKGNIFEKRSCSSSICVTKWQCGEFGECVNGVTARACSDLNNCGVEIEKPAYSLKCTCTPEYLCGEWSGCTYSQGASSILMGEVRAIGVSQRVCSDAKGCAGSYTETKSCEVGSTISFSSSVSSDGGNVLTAESESGQPVLSINLDTLRNENKLDIIFLQSRPIYPISCYNEIRDENEKGVDCGGECKECKKEGINLIVLVRDKLRGLLDSAFTSKSLSYVLIGIYFVLLIGYIIYKMRKKKYSIHK